MRNEQHSSGSGSTLFTLRLWQEAMGGDQVELRAEVRHVQSGEVRYFRDWGALTAFLIEKVEESAGQPRILQPIDG
jgi:hypothetical protein